MATINNSGYTVDGTTLDTYAFNVVNRAASWITAARRGEGLAMAGIDGELAPYDPPYEPGMINFTMWVVGANENGTFPADRRVQIRTNISKLMALFTKTYGLLTVQRIDAGVATKQCQARLVEAIDFESQARGQRAEFAVSLSIPRTFWEDINLVSQSQTFSGASPQTRSYSSFAGGEAHITDAKYSLTSSTGITNPRITDARGLNWIQYNGTVSASEILIIDCGLSTVKKGPSANPSAATNVMQNVTRAGSAYLFAMHTDNTGAASPQLTVSGTGSPTSTVQIDGRRKYLVA